MTDIDPGGLAPSRRARRARRAAGSEQLPADDTPRALLAAVLALQATTDQVAADVKEMRRRLTALTSKIELLDQRIVEGNAAKKLRTPRTPAKKATEPGQG